jgi:hypothetical protein
MILAPLMAGVVCLLPHLHRAPSVPIPDAPRESHFMAGDWEMVLAPTSGPAAVIRLSPAAEARAKQAIEVKNKLFDPKSGTIDAPVVQPAVDWNFGEADLIYGLGVGTATRPN